MVLDVKLNLTHLKNYRVTIKETLGTQAVLCTHSSVWGGSARNANARRVGVVILAIRGSGINSTSNIGHNKSMNINHSGRESLVGLSQKQNGHPTECITC